MPQHRCTIEFGPSLAAGLAPAPDTAGDLHGWTESWYRSTEEASTLALTALRNLATIRKDMLGPGWRITRIRVSIFPNARTAIRSSFSPQDGRGNAIPPAGNVGQGSEEPWDALTINVSSASGRSRVLSLRGLASGTISPGAVYLAPPYFSRPLGLWSAQLIQNFAIRVADPPVSQAILAVYISTVGNVTATRARPAVVFVAGGALDTATTVRISGVLGMSGINGLWSFNHVIDGPVIGGEATKAAYLNQKRGRSVLGTYDSGGVVSKITYSLSNITAVAPGYGTSRRTGSFSTRPRGRRSNRK